MTPIQARTKTATSQAKLRADGSRVHEFVVRLDPELYSSLHERALTEQVSKVHIVRQALRRYL